MNKLVITVLLAAIAFTPYDQKEVSLVNDAAIESTKGEGTVTIPASALGEAATEKKTAEYLLQFPNEKYLLFPEKRENEIRLFDALPEKWLERIKSDLENFSADVQPGEYFVFQVGIFAAREDIKKLQASFSNLKKKQDGKGVATTFTCFNLEGIDYKGNPFEKQITVAKGKIQPLWFGLQIPESAKGGYQGKLTITADGQASKTIHINLNVSGKIMEDGGISNTSGYARLQWLNSKIGLNNNITRGYEPIKRDNNELAILGRKITLNKHGLLASVFSFFDVNNEKLIPTPQSILESEIRFIIEKDDGTILKFYPSEIIYSKVGDARQEWNLTAQSEELELSCKGLAEFDGFIAFKIQVNPLQPLQVKDIRLEISLTKEMSGYMMGMNKEGGFRPEKWQWKWDVENKSQDAVWVGGVNGGIRLKLKGANYKPQLVNVYYPFGKLNLPESWGNGTKGGTDILSTKSGGALIKAYSGSRELQPGKPLSFDFDLLVTPVKLMGKEVRYNDRYIHPSDITCANDIQEAGRSGANIINIHHRRDLNPFINYPYLDENMEDLREFVNEAHKKNIRVKPYYTTRELTVYTPEIWALRSLGDEIIYPDKGSEGKTVINPKGPDQWLNDNFKSGFIPAWKTVLSEGKYAGMKDLSIITSPNSRWNNFFLEGLNFITKEAGTDGIYVDDCALDRGTMQRARKILDSLRPNARIDLHTWNHFNDLAHWACCLNLYMDLLPYMDQLWIGESRDYNRSPDYWLIEISGIPFGVSSQMLEGGGNKWRGMVFGITNRYGHHKTPKTEYIWQFWDKSDFINRDMIGFWDRNCPVKSSNPDLVTTVYKGEKNHIIAIGNWSDLPQTGVLEIDWDSLKIDKKKAKLTIPEIPEYQVKNDLHSITNQIYVEAGKGLLVLIESE